MHLLRSLALLSLATCAVFGTARHAVAQNADPGVDEAAIAAVIRAYIDTREANDAAGLGALLTADVDQLQTTGNMRVGREEVVAGTLDTTQATGSKRTIAVESLRWISSNVVIVDGRFDSLGRADGTDPLMRTTLVMVLDGDNWKIAAVRNMLPSSAPLP